jgi:nucleotide-binding universal stress UspA family protein
MMTFTRILCPVDFSGPSEHALAHAVAFGNWYEARLTVLHVAPNFEPMVMPPVGIGDSSEVVYPVRREEVLEALHRSANAYGASPSRVDAVAEAGGVVPTILDQALSTAADLIVIGTHGRSGFDRALLGSVAERVIHKAPCPVLTVPPAASTTPVRPIAIKKILCPVDFSPSSLVAVGFALDLARQTKGIATLLHTVEWPPEGEPRANAHFAVPEYRRGLLADAAERLHALVADEPRTSSDIKEIVVAGDPKSEILEFASRSGIDLMVMGTQGRGGLGLRLFGSTTERVVRQAACPVLSVRGEVITPS